MTDEKKDEPIDMRTAANRAEARKLAEASTGATHWGELPPKWLRDLSPNAEQMWCVYTVKDGETLVCAITGDGEESRANAALYVDARRMTLGFLAEIDRLNRYVAKLVDAGDAMADLIERVGDSRKDEHLCEWWTEAKADAGEERGR